MLDYAESIEMRCPTCGCQDFRKVPPGKGENEPVICVHCARIIELDALEEAQ